MGVVQGEEVVFYEENFNDNQAQDWELEPGWTVTEGMLSGSGHAWTTYDPGHEWSDYRVNFRLLLEEGSNIHLNYRLSENGRYYINFPNEGGLALSKEASWGTFHGFLTKSSISYGYNEWHNIEIIGEGPRIQVVVDGKLELDYTDPEPLLSGTIAFETLESAVAQVDDIIVFGPSPTQKGPDLAILSTNYWFEDGERVLVLLVEIVNQGNNEAPETQVFVGDIEHEWLNEYTSIQDLTPEETIQVEIRRDIPEELRGTMSQFRVVVDPEDAIREINEENNEAMTPRIQFEPLAEEVEEVETEVKEESQPQVNIPIIIFFIIAIGFIIFVLVRKRKTPLQEYKAKMEKWEKEGYDVTDLKREMELKK